jgi:hypothetical protein
MEAGEETYEHPVRPECLPWDCAGGIRSHRLGPGWDGAVAQQEKTLLHYSTPVASKWPVEHFHAVLAMDGSERDLLRTGRAAFDTRVIVVHRRSQIGHRCFWQEVD